MKHDFSDLTLDLTADNTPVTISLYRGLDYDNYQEALEGGATYNVNDLEDICDLKLSHFELSGAMSAADMLGQPEIMFAVHDDAQLFFECDSIVLTEQFVEEYRMQYLMHRTALIEKEEFKATILGWNGYFGGSFAVNYTYPASFTQEELNESAVAFIQDISRDHALDSDPDSQDPENILFITNILSGHQADDFKPFEHSKGRDQYNFPVKMPKWEYKLLSGNVLWCGGDYGTVEAHTESDALELAKEDLATHFAEVNRRLQGYDTFEFSEDDIEIMPV